MYRINKKKKIPSRNIELFHKWNWLIQKPICIFSRLGFICALVIQLTFCECNKRKTCVMLYMLCYITCVMCNVMLYNICHVMLYNLCHVMLYNICHVMLYNMCHVMLYNYMSCYITCIVSCHVI